jgi:stage V sporulation protein B
MVVRNVLCALIMGIAMYYCYDFAAAHTGLFLSLLITTIIGSAIYIGLMISSGGLTREDASKIPFFNRFF